MRLIAVLIALSLATPALAGAIAIVDFQRAVNETHEGKNAQQKLESGYAARKGQIEKQRLELEGSIREYETKKLILNEEARRAVETDIMTRQQRLQQDLVRYEQEMQQQYMNLVQQLDTKMRNLSGVIAKEKGYDLVLDKQAVVFAGAGTVDMTTDLITRYNSK
jgi:outer membrane protein